MSDTLLVIGTLLAAIVGIAGGLTVAIKVLIPAHKAAGRPVRRNGEWIGPEHPDYPR